MSGVTRAGGLYRLNVGVVVFNAEGKVWLGRRAGARGDQSWQFPQGGVDGDEALLDAARRELQEETGLRSVALLARAPGWITYDFPPGFTGSKAMKGYAGQTQAWFAFRFTGDDSEVDLASHGPPEFDAWRWEDLEAAPDVVVAFKRAAYEQVVAAFRPLVAGKDRKDAQADAPADDRANALAGAPADPPASSRTTGGRGEILMIHGAGATGRAFDRLGEELRQRGWAVEAPTLAADLRRSEGPPRALTRLKMESLLEETETWILAAERRSGRAPVLIGHSFGASLVLKLLGRHSARAAVLINPPPLDGEAPSPAAWLAAASLYRTLLFGQASKIPSGVLRAAVFNRAAPLRRGAFLAQQVYETPAVLAAMRMAMSDIVNLPLDPGKPPILILGGADDRLAPPAATKALATALGPDRTTLKIYPGHGHWMIDEPGLDRMVGDLDAWLLDRAK